MFGAVYIAKSPRNNKGFLNQLEIESKRRGKKRRKWGGRREKPLSRSLVMGHSKIF